MTGRKPHSLPPAPRLLVIAGLGVLLGCATSIDRRGEKIYLAGSCRELLEMAGVYAGQGELLATQGAWAPAGISFASAAAFWDALGEPDSAHTYHARAGEAFGRAGGGGQELAALRQAGETLHGEGRVDSALVVYRRVAALAGESGDTLQLGRAIGNLGLAHHDRQNPDSAVHHLRRAVALQQSHGDSVGLAVTENNLGRVFQTVGRPDESLSHFRRSLTLRRTTGDTAGEAVVLGNIGYSYDLADRPDSALIFYQQSLQSTETVCRPSFQGLAQMNVGRALLALGRLDEALYYLELSAQSKREVGDERGVGWALDNLGLVHQAAGRFDEAIAHHSLAAEVLGRMGDRARRGGALYHLGLSYAAQGDDEGLTRASEAFDRASGELSGIRSRTGDDPLRLSFAEQFVDLYARWSLVSLARPELDESGRAWAAIAAAERGRAQSLLDLLADTIRDEEPSGPLPVEGRELAAAALATGADALLYYLVTPDTLLTWLVDPAGGVAVTRVPVPTAELEAMIRAARRSIELPAGCDFFAASEAMAPTDALEALHALLIPAALTRTLPPGAEILIAPHGLLNLVPFAALSAGDGGMPLGIRYALRYTPSLALLDQGERNDSASRAGEPLVVTSPEMPRVRVCGQDFTPSSAEGQRRAGQTIARLLGVTPVEGADATEARVTRSLPTASVIHLGTHGFAYEVDAQARNSFVALAADPGPPPLAPGSDGLLTVADVLGLPRFSAELVVLSACETGMGDLKQAEGTVGLQRAFLSRGARAVLVSLWSVGDESTARLMESFYRHWIGGARKSEALRKAQEEMWLVDPAPFHWAAFQLVGAS